MAYPDAGPIFEGTIKSNRLERTRLMELTEAQQSLARINYSVTYRQLVAKLDVYIREEVFTGAALDCTREVIETCEGHYTAWAFRRRLLHVLGLPLSEELDYIRTYTQESPKNYQLWQHRQVIVERLGCSVAAEDLEVSKESLEADAKNIHCWQYRQWLLQRFDLWCENEWQLAEKLICEDEFNNSAWNHRSFLLKHELVMASDAREGLETELDWSLDYLLNKSSGCNESVWNYILWLLELPELSGIRDEVFLKLECRFGAWPDSGMPLYIRFLLLADVISGKGDVQAACSILTELVPIHRNFWSFISAS